MPWFLKTSPASEPVTLQEAKTHIRVDTTEEDSYILALITAARERIEDWLDRAIVSQVRVYVRDKWPQGRVLSLPGGRMLSLISVSYRDSSGVEHSFNDILPDTETVPARLILPPDKSWPADSLYPLNPIRVEYEVGYGSPADVPLKIKQALLLLVGHLYENREATSSDKLLEIPFGIAALLEHERVYFSESR